MTLYLIRMFNCLSQNPLYISSFCYAFIHSFIHFTKLQSMPDQILSLGDRNGLSPHRDDIKQIITILITSLTSGEIQLTIGSKQREFKEVHQASQDIKVKS